MNLHTQAAEERLEKAIGSSLSTATNTNAIVFHLSELAEKRDGNYHVNIAANILKDQLKNVSGDIYVLQDGDMVLTMKANNNKDILESIYQVRYLFADDSLAYSGDAENDNFCEVYNGSNNWHVFLKYCHDKIKLAANDNYDSSAEQEPILDIISSQVEDALAHINWDDIIYSQPVTTDPQSKNFFRALTNITYDRAALNTALGQNDQLTKNPNICGYVREFIEMRILIQVLNMISKSKDKALLFHLSTNTIKSEEFKIFSNALSAAQKRNLIIGIHICDVYKSLEDYFVIQKELSSQGYKLSLCGLDNISFLTADRQMLGFDILELKWQPALFKQSYDKHLKDLQNKIKVSGTSRVILTNCDSATALDIGRKLGVNLFKGHYINNAKAK